MESLLEELSSRRRRLRPMELLNLHLKMYLVRSQINSLVLFSHYFTRSTQILSVTLQKIYEFYGRELYWIPSI